MINILKNQQNILYVCPSTEWGTRERMVLSDILSLREIGHNTFLYCVEGSLLHLKAKEKNIDCIFCKMKGERINLLLWPKTGLKYYLHKLNITLVHCYELNFLWPLAFYLRSLPKVPLIFTFNHEIKKFYKKIWFGSLLKRVDLFLLPVSHIYENVLSYLDIPARRIEFTGMNLSYPCLEDYEIEVIKESINLSGKECWVIGASVSGKTKQLESLLQLVQAVKYLNSIEFNKPVKLILFSGRKWEEFELYPKISEMIEQENLGDMILLRDSFGPELYLDYIHLWITLSTFEMIEDFSAYALMKQIPLLAPRRSGVRDIFSKHGRVGESFMAGDGRELRIKIREILEGYGDYLRKIEESKGQISQFFQEGNYLESLFKNYNRVLNRRLRYFQ